MNPIDLNKLWADIQTQDWTELFCQNVERAIQGGNGWTSLCPFHDEANRSFSFQSNGLYCCFACGVRGNVYSFTKEIINPSGDGILEYLAGEAGLSIDNYIDPEKSEQWQTKKRAIESKRRCDDYFRKSLRLEHLARSGKAHLLTPENISAFNIGYCGNQSGFFPIALKTLGPAVLLETGLAWPGRGEPYLSLHDHITFPLVEGTTIAGWTARNLSFAKDAELRRDQTKWLHIGIKKGDVALGLNSCPKSDTVVICEGPWDLLAVRIALPEMASVAVLGTSIGDRPLAELRRSKVQDFVICLDPDKAGVAGTKTLVKRLLRARVTFMTWPRQISIAILPPDKDPGDPSLHPSQLRDIILNPQPWQDWWIETYSESIEGAQALREDLDNWKDPPYESALLIDAATARRSAVFAAEVRSLIEQKVGKRKKSHRKKQDQKHPLHRIWVQPYKDYPPFERDSIRAEIVKMLSLSEEEVARWNNLSWDVPEWGYYPTQEGFESFFSEYKRVSDRR